MLEEPVFSGTTDWFAYGLGVLSFALLVLASWCVGEGGEILGKKYDASVVGGLIIAWLNTAPEAIFFVTALRANNPSFAVGAVSGSTIVVSTVALGACLILGSRMRRNGRIILQPSVKFQCHILGISVIIPCLLIIAGFSYVLSGFAILSYSAFILYSIRSGGESTPNKQETIDLEVGFTAESEEEEEQESVLKGIAFLVFGGLLIVLFSNPFIAAVELAALQFEISPTLLAFFLAPLASEAPEILESISLSRKGNLQNINIAFSNLVGGSITKTTLLIGIFCYYGTAREFAWAHPSFTISMAMLSGCAAVAAAVGSFPSYQTEAHGWMLLCCFLLTGIIQISQSASIF